MPDTAFKLIVILVGGKDATGTVWFDVLFLYGRKPDGWDWVGSLFNYSFNANEGVWISDIYELPVKGKGKMYVLSAWVKIDSLIAGSRRDFH